MKNSSIQTLIEHATRVLFDVSDSAKLDAQLLLCFCIDKERSYLLTWPEKTIEPKVVERFEKLVQQRQLGIPIAYLIGQKEFWSLPFFCNKTTLIPRPDTEILVEQVLNYYHGRLNTSKACNILDLGTGTGAIALSLASELPHCHIDAVDLKSEAVKLANKNAKHLALDHVNVYQSDWFSGVDSNKVFDIIVSNPPYIDVNDEHLTQGDVVHEPLSALVADNDGLADIECIATDARKYLRENGVLFIEHGFEQSIQVSDILARLGYSNIKNVTDLNDNPRVTWASFCSTNT